MTSNIFLILIILLVIGIAIYFYYNAQKSFIKSPKKSPKKKTKKPKKQVRFNKGVKYFTYSNPSSVSSESEMIDVENFLHSTDSSNAEETWDSSFGIPLATKVQHQSHANDLIKNHQEYSNSFGKFNSYLTDDSTILKTDITIDPFKPESKSKTSNRTIKDIYDEQVQGPKPKPKKIKKITKDNVVYENDSEMNGGNVMGTNLTGFDGGQFSNACFGNQF